MTDDFKAAIEAALAAKAPIVTDAQRLESIEMLAQTAVYDAAAKVRLVEVAVLLAVESPETVADRWIAEAVAKPAAIAF